MPLKDLVAVGYTEEEARRLYENDNFHHKKKTSLELAELFDKISGVYNCSLDVVRKAILKCPQFAGRDHEEVIRKAKEVYGAENVDRIREAILKFPRFVGLDHERVVRQAKEVYGAENVDRIREAILKFPPFVGLDHERVLRQKTKLGERAGLSRDKVIDYLLDNPVLAGYSFKRYLAAFDIARQLKKEGFPQDKKMLEAFFSCYAKSPYVPGEKRLRISKIPNYKKEPPLLTAMRKKLEKIANEK